MIAKSVISLNYKGGVGKSTTSRVLAQTLAHNKKFTKDKPILIIDLDPQGNTSRRWELLRTNILDGSSYPIAHPDLESESTEYSSVCDLWLSLIDKDGTKGLGESVLPIPYETANPMIHVVPAHEELMYEVMSLQAVDRPKLGLALRQWLRSEAVSEKYSCVIIDTQPSKSPLIDAALTAGTHCYIPFIPEPQSVEGVYAIISYILLHQQNRGNDVPLTMLGLLPNMVSNRVLHRTRLNALKKDKSIGKYVLPFKFSQLIAYSETDDHRNLPGEVTHFKDSTIAFEANRFANYVVKRLEEAEQ